jgi:hypothetical protein
MFARLTAMKKDIRIFATRFLQSIRKNGHSVKRFVCVDAISKRNDSGSEPSGVNGNRAEGVADNVPKDW